MSQEARGTGRGHWHSLLVGLACLAIVLWPIAVAVLAELVELGHEALVVLAMILLTGPALVLVLQRPAAAVVVRENPPAAINRPGLAAPRAARRPPRILMPEPCWHCGLMPRRPRRPPRILHEASGRPSLASRIAEAAPASGSACRRRAPRIVHRH
jgi:hypothetical protein